MINHSKSRWMGINNWAGQPLYSQSPAVEEGMALGQVFESGLGKAAVIPSPGAATVFMGVAFSYYTQPTTAIAVETYTIPAAPGPYTVALLNTPVNPTTALFVIDANNNTYAYNASPTGYQYSITGNTLTFPAADAGNVVTIQYSYSPTLLQAQFLVGDSFPGHVTPSAITGTVGIIRQGIVYTNNIDTSVNWGSGTAVMRMGVNGTITTSGSGPVIPGYIYEVPSASSPFLGIYINM